MLAWVQIRLEGAAPNYTQIFLPAHGRPPLCSGIDFPPEFGDIARSGFFGFTGFNMDARGRGALIGTGEDERGRRRHYRYRTGDHGRHWQGPVRVASPSPGTGDYVRLRRAPAELVRDLRASVRRG